MQMLSNLPDVSRSKAPPSIPMHDFKELLVPKPPFKRDQFLSCVYSRWYTLEVIEIYVFPLQNIYLNQTCRCPSPDLDGCDFVGVPICGQWGTLA